MRLCRDHKVLARWKSGQRFCLLLDLQDAGAIAVYEPAAEGPLVELERADVVAGIVALRKALQLSRRVIETGKDERYAFRRTVEFAGLELDGLSDPSTAYSSALSAFEARYGARYPITEDLTK